MTSVINLAPHTHQANRSRIAKLVLNKLGLSMLGNGISKIIEAPEASLSNWHAALYLTERLFPSPKLAKVVNPKFIVDAVIEEITWQSQLPF